MDPVHADGGLADGRLQQADAADAHSDASARA
jgi:hypothetical protein